MLRLAVVLTVLPLVELALLLTLSRYTSISFTLGMVVVTGLVGAALLHHAGTSTLRRIRTDLAEHRLPADGMLDGVMILLAGILLLTPGVLTDLTGILLLIPPIRKLAKDRLQRWLKRNFVVQTPLGPVSADSLSTFQATWRGSRSDTVSGQAEVLESQEIDSPSDDLGQRL